MHPASMLPTLAAMELTAIAHVALPVVDLEATHRFYAGVLGLREAERPDFGFPGYWFELGAQQVHVFPIDGTTPGPFQHFAVTVPDVEAIARELDAAGVEYRRAAYVDGAGRQVFVADPTGHQIEFNQPDR
mgnify:CR=1 FL=1